MDQRELQPPTPEEQAKIDREYSQLAAVFSLAEKRAAVGKGTRHQDVEGQPFEEQDIVTEAVVFGIGPNLRQIRKKAKEIMLLPTGTAKRNELLDIMNYAAGAFLASVAQEQTEEAQAKIAERAERNKKIAKALKRKPRKTKEEKPAEAGAVQYPGQVLPLKDVGTGGSGGHEYCGTGDQLA